MKKQYSRFENSITKISRISWAAIFAGAITAITISFMLNILGVGIGQLT
jgi:hypothetical protein